jgi:hypothetical protein
MYHGCEVSRNAFTVPLVAIFGKHEMDSAVDYGSGCEMKALIRESYGLAFWRDNVNEEN